MPDDIVTYCAGLKIFLFSGNVADPASVPGMKHAYNYMDVTETNAYLTQIGFDSESTFVNTFTFQLTLLGTCVAHACVIGWYLAVRPFRDVERTCTRKVVKAVFRLFTFDIYIRMTISIFLFVVLSSMLETYHMLTPVASIVVSHVVLAVLFVFMWLTVYQWYATRQNEARRMQSQCRELYPELKDNRTAGLYTFFELTRVAALLVCISYGKTVPFVVRSALYTSCQVVFFAAMAWQRPFRKVVTNIMKFLNEANYCVLWAALNLLETKDKWSKLVEKLYLYLMMSISVQITLLCIGKLS